MEPLVSKKYINTGLIGFTILFSLSLLIYPSNTVLATESAIQKDVIITFKTDNIDLSVINSIEDNGGEITWEPNEVRSISATISEDSVEELMDFSTVKWVEIDKVMKISVQKDDWGIGRTGTSRAWNFGYTGTGIKVAVLDTGISAHQDLVISGGVSFDPSSKSYNDNHGHGTHVAGIISAKDNSIGMVGVAPDSQLYAVKVLGSDGSGLTSDIIKGIDWAISNNMDIINLSLGSQDESVALKEAVTRAINKGIVVVAAAGNDGHLNPTGDTVDYPASYDQVIAVGAIDVNNQIAPFSSNGPSVDVVAPGVSISSTLSTGNYGEMSGTSMATPYVTGIVALYKEAYPNYTVSQIQDLIKSNALDLGRTGRDSIFAHGLVQAPRQKGAKVPIVKAPTKLISLPNTNSIKLTWEKITGATSYIVKREGVILYSGRDLSFTETGLVPFKKYTYEVVTVNEVGVSKPATIVGIPSMVPPTNLTEIHTNTTAKLTWKAVSGATYYLVKNNKTGETVYKGTNAYYNIVNLIPGIEYSFSVSTGNAEGISKSVVIGFKTNPDKPNKPEIGVVTSAQTTISIGWKRINNAKSYEVKRNGKIVYTGAAISFIDKGLVPGSEYAYSITAKNETGISATLLIKKHTLPKTTYTTTTNLNLRNTNTTKGKILVTIPKGKLVAYISKSGNWFKVTYAGKTGWVSADYIKVTSIKTTVPTKVADTKVTTQAYIVKKGDTLYSVANKHKISVATLKSLNKLKNNAISVGQSLKVK